VFKAFFDESGGPESSKALIMGGFLGRVEEWEKASDAWDECLQKTPAIEFFTHKEAQSLKGQFEGWDRPSAEKKVLDLATVVSRFKLFGMCGIVPFGIFEGKDAKITKGMIGTRAYDWGFSTAIKCVLQHMKEFHPGEIVDFVFDEHTALVPNISMFYTMKQDDFFRELMSPCGACDPGDDKKIVALQMADLLAWEFTKHGRTQSMSDAFKIIRENNQIGYMRCDPPPQTNATMRLYQLSNDVRSEAIEFLKQLRNEPENLTVEDINTRLAELLQREAYHNVQWGRLLLQLDKDQEYQNFREGFLANKDSEDE
jgi:hypothetical protein